MCQILAFVSHDPAKLHEIIQKAWTKMAITQKDGYGVAWHGVDGTIGYLKRRFPQIDVKEPLPFVKSTKPQDAFAESNDVPSDGGFLIIHGRMATNAITLANTHPFIETFDDGSNVAMIHNGTVKSHKYSNQLDGCTCDSELLLRAYVDGGIDGIERYIDGKYAFMHLEYAPPSEEEIAADANAPWKKTLHIAKNADANLYCGLMPDKSLAFATTEYLLKDMGAEPEGEFKSNTLLVFSGPNDYEMTEYKSLNYWEKKTAGYFGSEPPKTTHEYPARHDYSPKQLLGPQSNILTKIEADILEQEKAEIEALERAPIGV